MQNADFTHWIIYARCGHSGFPQAVNKHSAEISESKEKFSKSSKIQLGSVTQKVSQGILRLRSLQIRRKRQQEQMATESSRNQKDKGVSPSGVANFVYG
jgi:predicted  nucleic acid-binding Zn-ribbon protein